MPKTCASETDGLCKHAQILADIEPELRASWVCPYLDSQLECQFYDW